MENKNDGLCQCRRRPGPAAACPWGCDLWIVMTKVRIRLVRWVRMISTLRHCVRVVWFRSLNFNVTPLRVGWSREGRALLAATAEERPRTGRRPWEELRAGGRRGMARCRLPTLGKRVTRRPPPPSRKARAQVVTAGQEKNGMYLYWIKWLNCPQLK